MISSHRRSSEKCSALCCSINGRRTCTYGARQLATRSDRQLHNTAMTNQACANLGISQAAWHQHFTTFNKHKIMAGSLRHRSMLCSCVITGKWTCTYAARRPVPGINGILQDFPRNSSKLKVWSSARIGTHTKIELQYIHNVSGADKEVVGRGGLSWNSL